MQYAGTFQCMLQEGEAFREITVSRVQNIRLECDINRVFDLTESLSRDNPCPHEQASALDFVQGKRVQLPSE